MRFLQSAAPEAARNLGGAATGYLARIGAQTLEGRK